MNVSMTGINEIMKDFSLAGMKAQGNADRVTETYTRKMANEAGANAPVDSGDMRANLIASPRRVTAGAWQFGGTLPYTKRQEYEHKTKKGFIRKAVWNNRTTYRKRLREEVVKWK